MQDPVFQANFLKDFVVALPAEFAHESLQDIDFSEMERIVEREKMLKNDPVLKKKLATERKAQREELRAKYGFAEIDGQKTPIANWMVEPPGLFMGRGEHPLRGHWKPRILPQDVTLNIDGNAPIPPGKWGAIIHDPYSMWIARWIDKLANKEKYVWLSDESDLRQERDRAKYDNAEKLSQRIQYVRDFILNHLTSKSPKERNIATVCYLVEKLAMRVGDEKDPDEADTVGATTLRVEHLRFAPKAIEFDFLGKDSVRWQKSLLLEDVDPVFHGNLLKLTKGKRPSELIFDGITSRTVNYFLGKAMKTLTAKVFRTFQATQVVRRYLREGSNFSSETSAFEKLYYAKLANLETAIRLNHMRTPPKNWEESLRRKEERLAKAKQQTPKTERAAQKLAERITKLSLDIDLSKRTKVYNLSTSLRNYIDPRVYKAWGEHVGFDWHLLYTKALQRKFAWAERVRVRWETPAVQVAEPLASVRVKK